MLSNEEKITSVKLSLFRKPEFRWYAYILMNVTIERDDTKCPTVCISETGHIYYNDSFISEITKDEKTSNDNLMFVFTHEIYHLIMETFPRRGTRDFGKWNIASDLVNNYLLISDGFTFSLKNDFYIADKNGMFVFDKTKFHLKKDLKLDISNMCAEAVYDALPDSVNKGGGNGKDHGGIDIHIEDDKCQKDSAHRTFNNRKIIKIIMDAITTQKMQGKGSAVFERICQHIQEPEISWKTLLYRYISNDIVSNYTWRTPGKRFMSTGIYLPRTLRENIEVYIAIDTSGSISIEEYSKFISECLGMCKMFDQIKLHIIYWADGIDKKDNIDVEKTEKNKLLKHFPKNSGGTNISCVNEYMKTNRLNPHCIIYFTDGHVESKPDMYKDNIVIISKGGSNEILKKHSRKIIQLRGE